MTHLPKIYYGRSVTGNPFMIHGQAWGWQQSPKVFLDGEIKIEKWQWDSDPLQPGKQQLKEFIIQDGYVPIGINLPKSISKDLLFGLSSEKSMTRLFPQYRSTGKQVVRVWLINNAKLEADHPEVTIEIFSIFNQ